MDHIRLVNMAFFGHHGVDPEERRAGRKLFLDVDLALDLHQAGRQDELGRTVDYVAVYQAVQRAQASRQCLLLEGLAEHVAQALLAEFPVSKVTVRVRKPEVPVGGVLDQVEVEITRSPADCAAPGGGA